MPELLDPTRFRIARLEDGEPVVMLRGWNKRAEYPSNNPHAGMWGAELAYLLLPGSSKQVKLRANSLLKLQSREGSVWEFTETDAELLLKLPVSDALELLSHGPDWCQAIKKRKLSPVQSARLIEATKHTRFTPDVGGEE